MRSSYAETISDKPVSFRTPTLSEREAYLERFDLCTQKASDYSFVNLWGWAEQYGLKWTFENRCAWIRQTRPEPVYWAPVGPWEDVDWQNCPVLAKGGTFIRVPETLFSIWRDALGDRLTAEESRDQWDYVYDVRELVDLGGKRYAKKKALLETFKRKYNFEYHPMQPDCVEYALELQAEWCEWRECKDSEALLMENAAIARVLKSWEELPGLLGGYITVDNTMVAYTVAEQIAPDTLVVHFEKGHTDFEGVYQAINQMFLSNEAEQYDIVNREQDLGDPGLRKAKLSYNPSGFLKKYTVTIAPE